MITPDIPAFAELVASLAAIDDEEDEAGGQMDLAGINLSLSIELVVRQDESGSPAICGSTPTQWTETTLMPAFHRLTLHVAVEEIDA